MFCKRKKTLFVTHTYLHFAKNPQAKIFSHLEAADFANESVSYGGKGQWIWIGICTNHNIYRILCQTCSFRSNLRVFHPGFVDEFPHKEPPELGILSLFSEVRMGKRQEAIG